MRIQIFLYAWWAFFFVCIRDGIGFLVSSKNGVFKRVYKAQGRSFPLQVLAFLRGGRRASSCLRGLATPPFPLESSTFRYNPLCGFKQGEIPFDYYKSDAYHLKYVIVYKFIVIHLSLSLMNRIACSSTYHHNEMILSFT